MPAPRMVANRRREGNVALRALIEPTVPNFTKASANRRGETRVEESADGPAPLFCARDIHCSPYHRCIQDALKIACAPSVTEAPWSTPVSERERN